MTSLVITGCQRSGTGYISVVLSAAGHWCGHERHYRLDTRRPPRASVIEASHMALPLLTDETVAWQLRHPLAVAASMITRGTIRPRKPARLPPSGHWALQQIPAILDEPSHVERCLRYWHDWNRRIQAAAQMHWRVEDLTVDDLAGALEASGRTADRQRLHAALELVPRDVNRSTPHGPLSWNDVPAGPARRDAEALAKEVGYQ